MVVSQSKTANLVTLVEYPGNPINGTWEKCFYLFLHTENYILLVYTQNSCVYIYWKQYNNKKSYCKDLATLFVWEVLKYSYYSPCHDTHAFYDKNLVCDSLETHFG